MRKLTFASLQVTDLEASKRFYTEKLGFALAGIPNPAAYVFEFAPGQASFAIRKPIGKLKTEALGVGTSLWFAIDGSIDDLHPRLADRGVEIMGDATDTPFGRALTVKDPDGYLLTFLEERPGS